MGNMDTDLVKALEQLETKKKYGQRGGRFEQRVRVGCGTGQTNRIVIG